MRKQLKWILLAAAAVLLLAVLAVGDDLASDDPLISLSYLTGTYEKKLTETFEETLKKQEASMPERWKEYGLDGSVTAASASAVTTHTTVTISLGSSYSVPAGAEFLMESGKLNAASSGLIDTTSGTAVDASGELTVNHLYTAASTVNLMSTADSRILIRK